MLAFQANDSGSNPGRSISIRSDALVEADARRGIAPQTQDGPLRRPVVVGPGYVATSLQVLQGMDERERLEAGPLLEFIEAQRPLSKRVKDESVVCHRQARRSAGCGLERCRGGPHHRIAERGKKAGGNRRPMRVEILLLTLVLSGCST